MGQYGLPPVSVLCLKTCPSFVIIKPGRFVYASPAMLPAPVTHVQILEDTGQIEVVKASQIYKLLPVKSPASDGAVILPYITAFLFRSRRDKPEFKRKPVQVSMIFSFTIQFFWGDEQKILIGKRFY